MQITRQVGPLDTLMASNLYDSALSSLGTTCKAMHVVCCAILQQRDERLQDMLSSYYTCINKYQVNSFINARLFCLGERHGSGSCQKIQKKIIHFLATRGPVVALLESLPSLQSFVKKDLVEVYQPIQLIAREIKDLNNIHYIGWDDEESVAKIRDAKVAFEKPFQEESSILLTQFRKLKNEIQEITGENEIDRIASNLGIEEQCCMFESPVDYMSYIKKTLGKTHLEEQNQIQNLIEKMPTIVKEKGLLEKIERYEDLEDAISEFDCRFRRAINANTAGFDLIIETLPARTKKMAETLSKIKEYIFEKLALTDARIVLISGQSHLAIKKIDSHIPEINLSHFYEEVSQHRAAIFIPSQFVDEYIT